MICVGKGKTEILVNDSIEKAYQRACQGEKIIYAVPSIALVNEVQKRFFYKGIKVSWIHSENGDKNNLSSVSKRIISAMESCNPDAGTVIVMTHTALKNLPYFPANAPKDQWSVIFDESFDPTCHIELRLKNHQHYITGVLSVPKKSLHLPFVPGVLKGDMNLSQQRAIIDNPGNDQFYEQLLDFYQHIENARDGKCEIFINTDQWKKFLTGDGDKFVGTVVYNPSFLKGFKQVVFAGALFEYELLYHAWKDLYGINWKKSHLSYEHQQHTNQLVVKYIFDHLDWSKYRANQSFGEGTVLDAIDQIVAEDNQGRPLLVQKNKDHKLYDPSWTECPYANRGLNEFRSMNRVYFSGAYNHPPLYYQFIDWLGFSEIVKISQNVQTVYQTTFRTGIRDEGYQLITTLYVPCKSLIDPIRGYFKNITFERLEGSLANELRESIKDKRKEMAFPKMPSDTRSPGAIRKARSVALKEFKKNMLTSLLEEKLVEVQNQKAIQVLENLDGNISLYIKGSVTRTDTQEGSREQDDQSLQETQMRQAKPRILNPNDPVDLAIILQDSPFMIFENIYSKQGLGLDEPMGPLSPDQENEIFEYLKALSYRTAKSKKDNLLCSPFIQDPKNPGRHRENVQSLFGQFMDFDTSLEYFYSKTFPCNVEGVTSRGHIHYVCDPQVLKTLKKGQDWTLVVKIAQDTYEYQEVHEPKPLEFHLNQAITIQDIQEVIGTETRIFLHSTFSGGNKRRAFILYDRQVSPTEHEEIARDIFKKIMKNHPHCQMDWSCTRANSLFYLPCHAVDKNLVIEDQGFSSLNVDEYLALAIKPPTIPGPPVPEEVIEITKETEDEEEVIYQQKVSPTIRQMAPGHRFLPAQKAVVVCHHFSPRMKWKLEQDLRMGGLDESRLRSMMNWYDHLVHPPGSSKPNLDTLSKNIFKAPRKSLDIWDFPGILASRYGLKHEDIKMTNMTVSKLQRIIQTESLTVEGEVYTARESSIFNQCNLSEIVAQRLIKAGFTPCILSTGQMTSPFPLRSGDYLKTAWVRFTI